MTAVLTNSGQLATRRVRAFLRQPWFIAVTLVQPMIWLLLFGQLFKGITTMPGFPDVTYIAFLTPGVVVMTAMFSNGWSGMSVITDLDRGVMDRFLVTPVRRGSLIAGDLAYQGLTTVLQTIIVLAIGWIAGARFPGGAASLLALTFAVVLLGTAFAALSNAIALTVRQEESVIGVNQFMVLPLAFLSSTLLPLSLAPAWIQHIARWNPVNWAVEVGRQSIVASPDWSGIGLRLLGLAAVALLTAWWSTRAFRSYQRSV
jgi:ABC-2 type transport system permease protein